MRNSKLADFDFLADGGLQPKNLPLIEPESPASLVFKEAGQDKGLKLSAGLSLELARTILLETGRLTGLVVNRQRRVVGLISLADLESVKVLAVAGKLGLLRSELVLKDLMTPVSSLTGVSYTATTNVSIADVIARLKQLSQQYLLVLDQTDQGLVGYFSAQDIAHKIGVQVSIDPVPKSFNDIVAVVGAAH